MVSPSTRADRTLRRHDLVFLSRSAWDGLLEARADLAAEPLVARWAERGRPLVARRPQAHETSGVALGLPLPPAAGRRRFELRVGPEDIVATSPPLAMSVAFGAAPRAWQPTLSTMIDLGRRHAVEVRVFGSFAWQVLTGLDYLAAGSDLDFVIGVRRGCDPTTLAAELQAIEAAAPMRLDGELVREDGAAVNWRELRTGAAEVMVKSLHGVRLDEARLFCAGVPA